MTRRPGIVVRVCLVLSLPCALRAQEPSPRVRAAQAAYEGLEFARAVSEALAALEGRVPREERLLAFEIMAFAYAAMDSTVQAVRAFGDMILLDPDREPDPLRISPRITSLYASALAQVLVVRQMRSDSVSFVAGDGAARIRFELSRPATVVVTVVGEGLRLAIDSATMAGAATVSWNALLPAGDPVPPGRYQLIAEARDGRERYAAAAPLAVTHGRVDTLPHLLEVPGYTELPELEPAPRDLRRIGLAVLYTAAIGALALAAENVRSDAPVPRELIVVTAASVGGAVALTLKKPGLRPAEANIRYNRLLEEQLELRNAGIARDNAERRTQVMVTVTPAARGEP